MYPVKNIVLLSLLIIAGCSSGTTQPVGVDPASPASTSSQASTNSQAATKSPSQPVPGEPVALKPRIDACALLTSKEIESVQGEGLKEATLSGQSAGGHSMSQCFFTLPTFTNSISLLVAQKGEGAGARNPREYWRDVFHKERSKDKDHDRKGDADKRRGEEEEEGAPPQKVSGVGEEGFWVGNRVGGALYVLKGNAYVRISIGGPSDEANKIGRSKLLARKALARL